jgi:nitrite reductase/ring-hydroxylating ferredoxin subunit
VPSGGAAQAPAEQVHAGTVQDFAGGARRILSVGPLQIGVLAHEGEYHAYENVCVHQGGPVCEGRIMGRVVDEYDAEGNHRGQRFDEERPHLVCPWHGFEYDLRTGEYVVDRTQRLRKFETVLDGDDVYVVVGA